MVQLFEQDIKTNDRQSSKGNQLKWCRNNVWYKADYMGYEGLVEYVVSRSMVFVLGTPVIFAVLTAAVLFKKRNPFFFA